MARTNDIFLSYRDSISQEVVNTFGGSYQTVETLGKIWRQQMPYNPSIEGFVILKTKTFLRHLEQRDKSNINMMYNVCEKIADYLSKYIAKKSPDLTRKTAIDDIMNKIFFDFDLFVNKFKQTYKKPIDVINQKYVESNPGIIAMAKRINQIQY